MKIADFGFAKRVTHENCLKTICGTAQYAAPEILDVKVAGYDHRADIWSLGILAYVLLGGYEPFVGPLEKLAVDIMRGEYEFHDEYWSDISPSAKEMISSMLHVRPDRRITAEQALCCKWMAIEEESLTLKDLSLAQEHLRISISSTDEARLAAQAVRIANFLLDIIFSLGGESR